MSIAVIGCGNFLMSDDGVGMHVLHLLDSRFRFSPGVTLIHGGIEGLDLLACLENASKVVLVDAVDGNRPPGTRVRLEQKDIPAARRHMSSHDLGVPEIIAIAGITGNAPDEVILWGIQPAYVGPGSALSPAVAAQLDTLVENILQELTRWGEHGMPA